MTSNLSPATLHVSSETKNLGMVRKFVLDQLAGSPLVDKERHLVTLAVDEAVANIIQHAYGEQPDGDVEITMDVDEERLMIVLRDAGAKFDPRGKSDVDLDEHISAGKKRGLGIFLIRKIMDEVSYNYVQGVRNELTLLKRFVSP
jgi:serine/threonine-protein kinase RsbW